MSSPLRGIDRVLALAEPLAGAWAARANAATTVGRERATVRLFGVSGLDRAGRPLAWSVVDRWLGSEGVSLGSGIALPFALAMLEYEQSAQEVALDVASGAIDLGLEARMLLEGEPRANTEAAALRLGRSALERIDANRTARRELLDVLGDAPTPWLAGEVGVTSTLEAIGAAARLVLGGADVVRVAIPTGRELAMRLLDLGLEAPDAQLGELAGAGARRGRPGFAGRLAARAGVAPGHAGRGRCRAWCVRPAFHRSAPAVGTGTGRGRGLRARGHGGGRSVHRDRRGRSGPRSGHRRPRLRPPAPSPRRDGVAPGRRPARRRPGAHPGDRPRRRPSVPDGHWRSRWSRRVLRSRTGCSRPTSRSAACPPSSSRSPTPRSAASRRWPCDGRSCRAIPSPSVRPPTGGSDPTDATAVLWSHLVGALLPIAAPTAAVLRRDPVERFAAAAADHRAAVLVARATAEGLGSRTLKGPAAGHASEMLEEAARTLEALRDEGWRAVLGATPAPMRPSGMGADAVAERTESLDPFA